MKTLIIMIILMAICSIGYADTGEMIAKTVGCVIFRGSGYCV